MVTRGSTMGRTQIRGQLDEMTLQSPTIRDQAVRAISSARDIVEHRSTYSKKLHSFVSLVATIALRYATGGTT